MISAHPDIAFLVARIEPDIVTWRRHLHAQPELSFKEFETSRFVAEHLRSFGGIEVSHVSETGLMGRLRGTSTGPTIALRADIDALPIHEENSVDFASRSDGVMHACGHDVHTAAPRGRSDPGRHARRNRGRGPLHLPACGGATAGRGTRLHSSRRHGRRRLRNRLSPALDDRERPGGGDGRPSNGGRRHVLAHHPRQGRTRGVPARDDRPDRDHVPGDHEPPAHRRPAD